MKPTQNTFIIEGLRLPIGKANAIYKTTIPEVLASILLAKFYNKFDFLKNETDEIILGNALGTGGNMARYAAIDAGFDIKIPAYTVDAQCASGLKAIILADNQIKAGANCVLAGGMESNSLAPKRQYHPNDVRFINDNTYYTQASFAPPQFGYDESLILAAENVANHLGISKNMMMNWAAESHQKANKASDNEYFTELILPFKDTIKDQSIKPKLTFETLQKSQSEKLIDYTNTAHLHDGAAVHFLASEHFCNQHGIKPAFQILATATTAGPPNRAPMGVIWAVENLLQKTGLKPDEIDLYEVNESFAINVLAFAQHFQVKHDKINTFGGSLAFGHPFGASGAINLLHLMGAMKAKNVKKGIVTIAAAGGLGMAVLLTAP